MTSNDKCKPYTSKDKWIVSIIAGLLYLLIASPFLYRTVSSLTELTGFSTATKVGYPNMAGLLLHSVIFLVVVRMMMR